MSFQTRSEHGFRKDLFSQHVPVVHPISDFDFHDQPIAVLCQDQEIRVVATYAMRIRANIVDAKSVIPQLVTLAFHSCRQHCNPRFWPGPHRAAASDPAWGREPVFCNMGLSLSYNYSSRISEKFARIFGDAPSIFLGFLGKPLDSVVKFKSML